MAVKKRASGINTALAAGGLAAMPSDQLANQLGNSYQSKLSQGSVSVDYTPADMKLITPDARKYRYTALDWEATATYRASKRAGKRSQQPAEFDDPNRNPLSNSQPVTVTQALTDSQVQPGPYMSVVPQKLNGFAIYTVGLKLSAQTGTHLRLNPSLKTIEAVPLKFSDNQPYISGKVIESDTATTLSLSLEQLVQVRVRLPNATIAGVSTTQYQTIVCWKTGGIGSTP